MALSTSGTWTLLHLSDLLSEMGLITLNDLISTDCIFICTQRKNSQSWPNDVGTLAFHWPNHLLLAWASKRPMMSAHWRSTWPGVQFLSGPMKNSQSWPNDVDTLAFHWPNQVLLAGANKGPIMSAHRHLT